MKTHIVDHALNRMSHTTVRRKSRRHGLSAGTEVELVSSVYTTNGHNRFIEGDVNGERYFFSPCDLNF